MTIKIVAGFQPGSRVPFVSPKRSKIIDASPDLIQDGRDASLGRAAQLAALTQSRRFMGASDSKTGRQASLSGGGTHR
ncbi:MAG TPA: hypothetical protein DD706_03860 [Nitrospiraceae bacterium]|nr:hypothetical protein [Nitrospiraceae bacterium]